MTKNLFVTSCHERVGKTTFCLALAMRLKQDGVKVGYFKPISDKDEDTDASHAKELLKMTEDVSIITPVTITEWEYDLSEAQVKKRMDKIKAAYEQLSKNYDILIIENCKTMNYLASLKLSARDLAPVFKAEILLLIAGSDETHIDEFLLGVSFFNDMDIHILGGLISLVPLELIERMKEVSQSRLGKNYRILGVVPEKPELTAPTVEELLSSINAKVLAGEEYLDNLVENYLIGAMELDNALKFFRKSIKKAVIIGGDRPSLAIAAMETDTSVVILTGGIYPPSKVLSVAAERKIPVLLVQQDTYSLVQHITRNPIQGVLTPSQTERLEEWNQIFTEIDYEYIKKELTK